MPGNTYTCLPHGGHLHFWILHYSLFRAGTTHTPSSLLGQYSASTVTHALNVQQSPGIAQEQASGKHTSWNCTD
jgi:hypothetical protein